MNALSNFLKWVQIHTIGKGTMKIKLNLRADAFHIDGTHEFREVRNLVTTIGKAQGAGLLNGVVTDFFEHLAVGVGTGAPAAGDTALGSEITDSGMARASATTSRVTTSTANDTAQWVKSWSVSGTKAVTESGIFDTSSAGNLLARQTFSALNVASGDTLQITWKVQLT